MRVLFYGVKGAGHVNPTLPLVRGLVERGHRSCTPSRRSGERASKRSGHAIVTPEQLRAELRRSNDPKLRYLVNFTRKVIFGGAGGHHSPIGGYVEPEDLVFVLDVNRDFGPWLIARDKLYAAMDTLDGEASVTFASSALSDRP